MPANPISLLSLVEKLPVQPRAAAVGHVTGVQGPLILAQISDAAIGDVCTITLRNGNDLLAQVVRFTDDTIFMAPFDNFVGLSPGAKIVNTGQMPRLKVSQRLLGRVIDPLGQPLDAFEPADGAYQHISAETPDPLSRVPITQQLETGVSVIDSLCSLGVGQRLGLFAGAGVGKSTLLGMIARNASVDVTVIALVGERGREVQDFINESLGAEGLKKSVVVVATSDDTPLRRMLAAKSATAVAEYFRSQGKDVLLLVDSLTRVARAIRDVSLAAGELPIRQGFTASVYAELPQLVERAGNVGRGSITALYTVLSHAEHESDALAEEIKSLLDGHIFLSDELAQLGIRPAVDVTKSISRLMGSLHGDSYLRAVSVVVRILKRIRKDKDILLLGGVPDSELKIMLNMENQLLKFLCQRPHERREKEQSLSDLMRFAQEFDERMQQVLGDGRV